MPRPIVAVAVCASSLALAACGGGAPPRKVATPVAALRTVPAPEPAAEEPTAGPPPEHWYFEHLAPNGRHALLRRLDPTGRSTLQTRIVDVDTGAVLEEVQMPELGKFPGRTIGLGGPEVAKLDAMLASPRFEEDLARGAHVAKRFPFGSCGRLSAGVGNAGIAFNAGDWLYLADAAGKVRKKLAQEAAYDPRFSPDGKFLFFRRAAGSIDRVFAKYELVVMPADLSSSPRAIPGTAGVRETIATTADGGSAIVLASHEPIVKTCVLSVALKPPFAMKKLGCLEGSERLVESTISPKGRFVALTTQTTSEKDVTPAAEAKGKRAPPSTLAWRLRVLSLATGQVVYDAPTEAGYSLRGISEGGTLVQSGMRGVLVDDVTGKSRRELKSPPDLGHRVFFRSDDELVVQRGGSVAVVDVRTLE